MSQDEQLLNELKKNVLDNLENEQFSVEQLSQSVGVSRSHLHRKLKKLRGQSISQFIREVRLSEALKLLRRDVATASEIAYKVGFNSPSYFHKCFQEYYGYPPSEAKHVFQNQSVKEDVEGDAKQVFQNPLITQRQLAAILFVDIVGYTAMMQQDEKMALQKLNYFKRILESSATEHLGRIIQYYGDGCLIIFNSSAQAVRFAQEVQNVLQKEQKVAVRVGIHSGDIVLKEGNVFGDAVNIANRVESLGVSGSVLLSSNVRNQIKNKPEFELQNLGRFEFKNVEGSMTVYALANEGLVVPQKEEIRGKIKQTPKPTVPGSKFIKLAGIFILLALLIFFLYKKFGEASLDSQVNIEKSIAILPFNSLSADEENQHFADGLVEDLLNRLALIDEFKVISRTSSDTYRNRKDKKIPEIAAELGVSYIIEGSVQKHDNKARITVQVIDAKNDNQVWNESYDRDLTDVFNVQSEIAMRVASQMSNELTNQQTTDLQKSQTENVKAFEAYQLGRYYWGKRKFEEYEKAIHFFEEAIAEDPNYALAYAGLADTYFLMNWHFSDVEEIMRYRDKAEEYALKALEIDERLAEAHTVLATLYFFIDWDWANAEKTFLKALKLNPNYSTLHHRYAEHLSQTGRYKEARKHMNKAIELDPLSYVIRRNSTALYFNLGQFEKAMAEAQLSEELGDGNDTPILYKFVINYALDNGPATLANLKKLQSYDNDNFSEPVLDSIYYASGKEGLMRFRIEATPSARGKAELYAIKGENDQAVNWLETALAEGDRMADVACLYSPNGLHTNPRFIALLEKMNLPWKPDSSR